MKLSDAIREVKQVVAAQAKQIAMFCGATSAVLAIVSVFTAHPVATFFWLLSYLGIAMTLFSAALMLVTFRSARALVPTALAVVMATTILASALSLWLANGRPSWLFAGAALAAGVALGGYWSTTLLIFVDNGVARGRGSLWYLAVWAGVLALNQIATGFLGFTPDVGGPGVVFAAGVSLGNSLGLIVRTTLARRFAARLAAGEASS